MWGGAAGTAFERRRVCQPEVATSFFLSAIYGRAQERSATARCSATQRCTDGFLIYFTI